jgi:hypothetical protein
MEERRRFPRMRVLKTGKIIVTEKSPAILCTVRNVSVYGACLQVDNHYGIPDAFAITIDGVQHPCRVVWRATPRIGVSFKTDERKRAA